jgi:hypothetical protein
MPATDWPRSPVKTPAAPRGWKAAIWCAGISAPECAPLVDRSTSRTGSPAARIRSRM